MRPWSRPIRSASRPECCASRSSPSPAGRRPRRRRSSTAPRPSSSACSIRRPCNRRPPLPIAAELNLPRERVDDAVDSLIDAGLLVRLRGEVLYPASRLDTIEAQVRRLLDDRGEITLAGLRDELAITRKYSQAILEYVDGLGITVRIGDRHVLRRPSRAGTRSGADID